jgi:hypothetical protein
VILNRIGTAVRARDWAAVMIEFSIVVLGIFVALQAENWNQGRRDRQLEQDYISRLADETKANIDILTAHEQIFEEKLQFIFALPDLPLDDALQRDPQGFMYQLDYSSYVQIPNLRSETYQELESSGRLAILRDARVRSAIASSQNDYRSTRSVFIEPIGNYRRLLFETLPGRSFYDYRLEAGAVDAAAVVASIDAFRSDPRFEAAANAEIAYGSDALFYVREYRRRSEDILSLLQAGE